MRHHPWRGLWTALLLAAQALPAQQPAPADPALAAMQQELTRSMQNLKQQPVAPYFLSYQLTDNRAITISGSFGTLISSTDHRTRMLDIDLRVGDPALDNTHPLRGGDFSFPDYGDFFERASVPIENDAEALRTALWYETDEKYKHALERLGTVKANAQVKVAPEDKSGDFWREPAERYLEPEAPFAFDRAQWEDKIRKYTAPFARQKDVIEANAQVTAEIETRRYVNSDSSEIRMSSPLYRLIISASSKAADGMELPLHRTYMSFSPGGLPTDEAVLKDVNQMVQDLLALRNAPLAEPYTGPAILSGRASAVFFHEIFGHRVEGQRQKREDEAQTFKKKLNQAVLPGFLSVYSDPTLKRAGDTELVGYYPYDDEGVKARRVTVVENGVLKNFLLSRAPVEGFDQSNGHGRRQQGYNVVARQSNLLVSASQKVTRAELKRRLLEELKAEKRPYGLLFDDIEGGFTFTERVIPNAFNVRPTKVYRIYADGREELVRGVDLIGTPLTAFSKIAAADDEVGVFNGVCGAESGWVPVAAISPGLLISQIEVQRKEKSQERAPILPPPFAENP